MRFTVDDHIRPMYASVTISGPPNIDGTITVSVVPSVQGKSVRCLGVIVGVGASNGISFLFQSHVTTSVCTGRFYVDGPTSIHPFHIPVNSYGFFETSASEGLDITGGGESLPIINAFQLIYAYVDSMSISRHRLLENGGSFLLEE